MFNIGDIAEVVERVEEKGLYPGMFVQIIGDNIISEEKGVYKRSYDVRFPVITTSGSTPYYIRRVGRVKKGFLNPCAINTEFFERHLETVANCNEKTIMKYREKLERVCALKDIPLVELEVELHRRGFAVFRKEDELLDLTEPKKIIFNYPATVVFWNDGTKTVVKCADNQKFSEYYGYLAALAKRLYGTNGTINRLIDKYKEYDEHHSDNMTKSEISDHKKIIVDDDGNKMDITSLNDFLKDEIDIMNDRNKEISTHLDNYKSQTVNLKEELTSIYNKLAAMIYDPEIKGKKRIAVMRALKKHFPDMFDEENID